jgi:hypothetical protein
LAGSREDRLKAFPLALVFNESPPRRETNIGEEGLIKSLRTNKRQGLKPIYIEGGLNKVAEKEHLSRRDFLKDAGLVAGGALLTTSALSLAGFSQKETAESARVYACPYCATETVFDTAAALKDHIYTQHLYNNSLSPARRPIPMGITIGNFSNEQALKRRIAEIVNRGWRCTLRRALALYPTAI